MAEHCVLLRRLPRRLLAWYGKAKRQLPWRDTRDPYRVWLAEVMLQQTRVDTVIPYYGRFLARFPTLASVAEASCDEVLELWAGLGYYARARSFHAAARQVVRAHGGQVPRDPGALRALPGVGPYTAAAVLSIAYGVPVAAVDGNVARVLCRLFGLDGDPRASAPGKRLRALAEQLLPRSRPGDFNEAMMELGATLCTPRRPACDACCAAELCEARRRGRQDELPARARRKPVPHYDVAVGLVWRRGKLLLTKRPHDAMLGGLWEFPGGKRREGETLEGALRREIKEETGLEVTVGAAAAVCKHAYSHFRVTLHAYHCTGSRGRPRLRGCEAYRWARPEDLGRFALPAGTVKIIRQIRRGGGPSEPEPPP